MSLNVGDLLFQLIAFLLLVVVISLMGMFIKNGFSQNARLKRLEEKVDELTEEKRRERP
jgi:Tfp pilus assembly protein FimT